MKYLVGFCFIASLMSCREISLTGKWQLTKIEISPNDLRYAKGISPVIDFADKEALRRSLFRNALTHSYNETMRDTTKAFYEIDSVIRQSVNLGIELKPDSTFIMVRGQIFEPPIPGWHFPKDLTGKWQKDQDTLFLQTDLESTDHLTGNWRLTFTYKILELNADNLTLQELGFREAIRYVSGMHLPAYQPSTITKFRRWPSR